jgi:hypothetical protein
LRTKLPRAPLAIRLPAAVTLWLKVVPAPLKAARTPTASLWKLSESESLNSE